MIKELIPQKSLVLIEWVIFFHLKAIPKPADGLNIVAFFAQFQAEFFDMGVYGSTVAKIIKVPDGIENLVPAKGDAGIIYEI